MERDGDAQRTLVEARPGRAVRPLVLLLMVGVLMVALCVPSLVGGGPWPWQLAKLWHGLARAQGGTLVPPG